MVDPDYESLEKLESFFRKPYSLTDGDVPILIHYTGLNSVYGILDKSKFWASHMSYMNDPNDGYEIYNFILFIIRSKLLSTRFFQKISHLEFIYGNDDFIDVNKFSILDRPLSEVDRDEFLFDMYVAMLSHRQMRNYYSSKDLAYYIVSFSKYKPDTSIDPWRSYAKDARGFRLEFDFSELKKSIQSRFSVDDSDLHVNFFECIYLPAPKFAEGAMEIVDGIINIFHVEKDRVDRKNLYVRLMIKIEELSLIMKNESYQSENEVRLLIGRKTDKNVCYRPGENLIIPYLECDFELKSLKKIVCGPRTLPRTNYSIINFLSSRGGEHVEVKRSSVSYVGPY